VRFILPAIAASFVVASTARAETSAPIDTGCFGAEATVPPTLPANVPGIPFNGSVGAVTASLLAPDGTVVSDRIVTDGGGISVLAIDKELTPGTTYTVRWSDACDGMRTKSFVATAVVAFAKSAGTLSAGETNTGFFNGRCNGLGQAIFTVDRSLRFTAAADLEPFLAIARTELRINDVARFTSVTPYKPGMTVGSAGNSCPGDPLTHTLVLRVFIPNGPTIDSDLLTTEVACPAEPPGPCVADPEPDPESPEVNNNAPTPPGEAERAPHYGCTSSRGATTQVGMLMIAVAMALATRRSRQP
jgi:hypothetical protein